MDDATETLVPRRVGPITVEGQLPRRLKSVTWVALGLSVFAVGLTGALAYIPNSGPREIYANALQGQLFLLPTVALVSLAMHEVMRHGIARGPGVVRVALLFESLIVLLLSFIDHAVPLGLAPSPLGFPSGAIFIVFFAAMVPLPPRKAAIGAVIAALMEPAALYVA